MLKASASLDTVLTIYKYKGMHADFKSLKVSQHPNIPIFNACTVTDKELGT